MTKPRLMTSRDGVTHTRMEWGRILGMTSEEMYLRTRRGWTDDEVLSIPKGQRRPRVAQTLRRRHPSELRALTTIKTAVLNKSGPTYASVGAKGITLHEPWYDFAKFLADVGPRPTAKHRLVRVDVCKNYEPGNVEWSVRRQNHRTARVPPRATRARSVLLTQELDDAVSEIMAARSCSRSAAMVELLRVGIQVDRGAR